ncbi:hypothetical protein RHSIM_Rhsim05G0110400 [Rhododendron simsii]|uniref:FAD-binding FR-type domain-containing protein n=1 Tax=Rhododendron simsii TaxID=118357 RepID=A0A834LPA9_RHOSS|nr:hypothetical protein RHSIM_Rhsim05G0110400 [Rhododendron simsii]
MDELSATEPLVSSHGNGKKKAIFASSMEIVLKYTIWVIFISWATFIFLYPSEFVDAWFEKYLELTDGSCFGIEGSMFLAFSAPILVIAFLAIEHLLISGDVEFQVRNCRMKSSKRPGFRLWTFPVLVNGPFGVVSAAELIGILLFLIYVIWAVYAYTLVNFKALSEFQLTFQEQCYLVLELTGLRLGMIGLFCLVFLFLPVARGSVLLRLVDIPFELATRYHVWLGHLTMLLFTLHGLLYIIAWALQGELLSEVSFHDTFCFRLSILEWKTIGVANLAGVISLAAGLFMWVTSLPPVRRQNFELFFYTHQLYIVFVVFLAMHVGDFIFSIAAGGIFLFILDRFLRFCQSRRTVNVVSANCSPCGTVELVVSKPANLQYNALSFIFLQVRELSWLQWHPFSVSSSPLDGKYHMSILIKNLGEWTEKLRGKILNGPKEDSPMVPLQSHHANITVSVEGPYGHELPYHLTYVFLYLNLLMCISNAYYDEVVRYENLILVAGGIGISPFLAILSDILHRINDKKPCLPRNVLVVWALKTSDELPLLYSLDMESICPVFSDTLNFEIQTYVTQESEPWLWYKGLLFDACMVGSPIIFGGVVVNLWHIWETKASTKELGEDDRQNSGVMQDNQPREQKESSECCGATSNIVRYGCRPDFKEIFGSIAERWGHVDVGVIACGPPTLQTSIAKECRSQSLRRKCNHPIFHFNSHSFDL